jgi:extracellular factor (EF) 3-hydroxypalmitic acid methyl ester biosynthesis protein
VGHQTNAYVHESFDVTDKNQEGRVVHLRQERVTPTDVSCRLVIGRHSLRVLDYSATGIAVLSDRKFDREMSAIPFRYANIDVMELDLCETRCTLLDSGKYRIAYEVVGEPIDFDRLEGLRSAYRLVQQHKQYVESSYQLPARIKARVYETKDWLEQLMDDTNALVENEEFTSAEAKQEFEEAIVQQVSDYFADMFPTHVMAFAQEIAGESDDVKKQAVEFLRHKLHDLIYQAPFAQRVYSKPLGYAGDFEMMNLIYRSENLGKTLFARCLQRYYINEPSAQAVRNRVDYFAEKITELVKSHPETGEPIRILSVACGPAMEWQKLVPVLPDNVQLEVDLLDQDEQALLSTQRQIKRLLARYPEKSIRFRYLNKAIKNIIVRGTERQNYDLVYSSGLFDYLSDSASAMAASRLLDSVKPGGRLIIGNFNVGNPNQLVMDYALDWPLIYRSKEDLIDLFKYLEGSILIESEPLGINLFCVITRTT